jgi:hypothetical protein
MLIQLVTGQAFNIKKTSGSWYKENSFKEKLKASPDFQEIGGAENVVEFRDLIPDMLRRILWRVW